LLFQVQPLLSKRLLPWFGGSPAVWTTCVLFFQTVLFVGYAYAHASEHWLPRSVQSVLHIALLAVAVTLLPILPSDEWKPKDSSQPIQIILAILATSVGMAYVLLSSTGPLVAAWFSRVLPDRSVYRLYALSNFGSLAALLTYPFVFEPAFSLAAQAGFWAWGFRLFALLSAASALVALGARQSSSASRVGNLHVEHASPDSEAPARRPWLKWIGLPAFASLAFLATTNVVCQDVAVVPFLWVAPLSLYLLSFIICFDHERWYRRGLFAGGYLALVAFGPFIYPLMSSLELSYQFVYELVLYLTAMFFVCMICHGELVLAKPAPRYLTSFYLAIAAGGALGGVLVSLVAPVLFSTYYEWPIAAIGGCFLAGSVLIGDEARAWVKQRRLLLPTLAVAILVALSVGKDLFLGGHELIWQNRNFYGVVTVTETVNKAGMHYRLLRNGRITHGIQFTAEDNRRLPTSYYGPESGVEQTIAAYQSRPSMRVGAVGLGVGTIATYARPGDDYRFYEINPQVVEIASELFTFLSESKGHTEIVLGDARLSLEREPPQDFDVLVLDAFSGDAIPTHLLTTEAFQIYDRHLARGGALCIHVSNQYLDLTGVVRRLADLHGYEVVHIDQGEDEDDNDQRGVYSSEWMVLSKDSDVLAQIDKQVVKPPTDSSDAPLWTDEHTGLFRILK
jgi:hypothetical protein